MKAYLPGNAFRSNPQWFEDEWLGLWGGMEGRTWWVTLDPTGPNWQVWFVPLPGTPFFTRFTVNWF